jgi:hypothetical protein
MEVHPLDTIGEIKGVIESPEGILNEYPALISGTKLLEDAKQLTQYRILEDALLLLLHSP